MDYTTYRAQVNATYAEYEQRIKETRWFEYLMFIASQDSHCLQLRKERQALKEQEIQLSFNYGLTQAERAKKAVDFIKKIAEIDHTLVDYIASKEIEVALETARRQALKEQLEKEREAKLAELKAEYDRAEAERDRERQEQRRRAEEAYESRRREREEQRKQNEERQRNQQSNGSNGSSAYYRTCNSTKLTDRELKRAYIALVQRIHPDKHSGVKRDMATELCKQLNQAYNNKVWNFEQILTQLERAATQQGF